MILVAGSTGILGGLVAQQLAASGHAVRGLVRTTSDVAKRAALDTAGVETVEGDLRDVASLHRACAGVRTVISTVCTTVSRQPGDTIEATDRDGQLALADAAEAAGVEHFVLLSFNEQPVDSPLQQAKRAVEKRLVNSALEYTILRPTYFIEAWLSPALGFDHPNRTATVFGDGTTTHAWISLTDVAGYVTQAVDNPAARNAVFDLGGPDLFSIRDVVAIFEDVTRSTFVRDVVPADVLRARYDQATDSLERTITALMLNCAQGTPLDPRPATDLLPLYARVSVRDYAQRVTASG
jgi:NADH dehydrogenase